jgi:hypothetical protein
LTGGDVVVQKDEVRLSQWHVKVLEAAQHHDIVSDFENSTHILILENVPPPLENLVPHLSFRINPSDEDPFMTEWGVVLTPLLMVI